MSGALNFEDKIVEAATKRTLEPIYEAVFEEAAMATDRGAARTSV